MKPTCAIACTIACTFRSRWNSSFGAKNIFPPKCPNHRKGKTNKQLRLLKHWLSGFVGFLLWQRWYEFFIIIVPESQVGDLCKLFSAAIRSQSDRVKKHRLRIFWWSNPLLEYAGERFVQPATNCDNNFNKWSQFCTLAKLQQIRPLGTNQIGWADQSEPS